MGKFLSIRKTYFLQVKRLILVGTLEKCAFFILLILKSYSTCGVGYGSLWIAFYIETKDDYYIMFSVCN
ncbi:hypothetical protein LIMHP_06200 [Leptospira interrogans serovar Manilae]|nr:hypothetical protein LIMLP_06210 [Leptospira interrogans serovar Manilae]AKP29354.1 hypothetical protein LIMHP_06200 [Leptospira interrogans serovar Manilae]